MNGNDKDKNQPYGKLKWTELMILIGAVLVATIFIIFYFNLWSNDMKVFQNLSGQHKNSYVRNLHEVDPRVKNAPDNPPKGLHWYF
jgi:hypothetical protein